MLLIQVNSMGKEFVRRTLATPDRQMVFATHSLGLFDLLQGKMSRTPHSGFDLLQCDKFLNKLSRQVIAGERFEPYDLMPAPGGGTYLGGVYF